MHTAVSISRIAWFLLKRDGNITVVLQETERWELDLKSLVFIPFLALSKPLTN